MKTTVWLYFKVVKHDQAVLGYYEKITFLYSVERLIGAVTKSFYLIRLVIGMICTGT